LYLFDVIAITETWQTDSSIVDTFLPDYIAFHTNRKTQRGGGVSVFVKSLSVTLMNNLSFSVNDLFECITVEIENRGRKNTVISCIYRKPGTNLESFIEHIEKCFDHLQNKDMYLCGDFNIEYEHHNQTKCFIDAMFTLGLLPLISVPTRITPTSETLIDNIFTNVICTNHHSGVLITDISDHLPIFTICDKSYLAPINREVYVYRRKIDDSTLNKLNLSLKYENWQTVLSTCNANDAYDEFIKIFMRKVDENCPEISIKTNNRPNCDPKPWFTKSLKNCL